MKVLDEKWMARALELAWKADGKTRPNPVVGAVVVKKEQIVGEGYHPFFGGPHAEIVALKKAGLRARNATLYVTLEPCSSWGKTPPCVDSVIKSGVKRVVIGSLDPNPRNYRLGIQKLKNAGIQISTGVLAKEVERQNAPFFKAMKTALPFVTLKLAQSLDGKIATSTGESRWISSKVSRNFVHHLRSQVDAALVGKNTAILDNPRLRAQERQLKPWRIVLDPRLELGPHSRIFRGSQMTLVAVSEKELSVACRRTSSLLSPLLRRGRRQDEGVGRILIPVPEKRGKLNLKILFQELASLGIQHLLVEGGGELAWSLLEQRLVDRLIWIVAPKIIGGRDAKTAVEGEGVKKLSCAFKLEWRNVYCLGEDWVFEASLK